MLIATPYRDYDVPKSPPKVISEIRKSYFNGIGQSTRPKLCGELLVRYQGDPRWFPRRAQIRHGQLHLIGSPGVRSLGGAPALKVPLRHLSLKAGNLPHSLSLCRGQSVILTLQTNGERSFDEWVRTIAIELIRQTPLDSIKYLDILTIAECWRRNEQNTPKTDFNFNDIPSEPTSPLPDYDSTNQDEVTPNIDVENLLKKCQNGDNYVPVKEKLFLFESLCKLDRKVRSTEDVSQKVETSTSKRARSLHDLSKINSHIAVREICKYFENKQTESKEVQSTKKVVSVPESPVDNLYKFRKVWTT